MTRAFLTPNTPIPGLRCRVLRFPDDDQFEALVAGALTTLTEVWNWETHGDMSAEDTANIFFDMLVGFNNVELCMHPGMIVYLGGSAIPDGWLECDGSQVNQDDYPALYAAIGATFGAAPPTQFTLPNLASKFVRVGAPGATGGQDTVTLTEPQMPVHSHVYVPPIVVPDLTDVGLPLPGAGVGVPVATGSAGGGQSHTNVPAYISLKAVIKT